jgi:phospholipid transport system substrate-binding protein
VRTQVTLDDGETVPVNYGLVERNGEWKVYDVTIEGISYVRNFRSELDAEISKDGLDAVITRLESESSSNAQPSGGGAAAAEGSAGDG